MNMALRHKNMQPEYKQLVEEKMESKPQDKEKRKFEGNVKSGKKANKDGRGGNA